MEESIVVLLFTNTIAIIVSLIEKRRLTKEEKEHLKSQTRKLNAEAESIELKNKMIKKEAHSSK